MTRLENQTLALAGMFQAAVIVDEIALHGSCDPEAFDCCFNSLFTIEAETTEQALGDITHLARGFEALGDYLGGENRSPGKNIAYYLLSILKIAVQVLRDQNLSNQLLQGLRNIESNASDFNLSHGSVINKIDGLYQECISSMSPRIIVRGEQNYLRNSDNAARIRVLLLAGIRAAVLWQQLGGNKWTLFWSRKKYISAARHFLTQS